MVAHWQAEFANRRAGSDAIQALPEDPPVFRFTALAEEARRSGDWLPVAHFFEDVMALPGPPPHALLVARALASAQQWTVTASHVDALLRFATSESVRLVVYALVRTHQPHRALDVLAAHRTTFPAGVLPNDLRRLEIEALQAQGDVAGALQHASILAAESPALIDQLAKVNVHLRTGHLRAALPTLRQAMESDSLSAADALQLVQLVAVEDMLLAKQLWRHAHAKGVSNNYAPIAVTQAFHLGLDHEVGQLFGVIAGLAHQGTDAVRTVSLDELAEYLRTDAQDAARLQQLYFDGVAPVHLIAARRNINLAVMIRHAARLFACEVTTPIADWRLYLDVTTLLLADQLHLLDALECLPHPLAIPPSLPVALQQMQFDAQPHQPHRVEIMQALSDALAEGAITIAEFQNHGETAEAAHASEEDSVVHAAQALTGDATVVASHQPAVEAPLAHRVTTLGAVLDGVLSAGAIDMATYDAILPQLGTPARVRRGDPPTPGAALFFMDNALTVLAGANALNAVAQVYRIQISNALARRARKDLAQTARDKSIAEALGCLRNRVAAGLESGRYLFFQRALSVDDAENEDPQSHQAAEVAAGVVQCLYDGIHAASSPGAYLCTDDRHLTGYQQSGSGVTIIGITDVLLALQQAGIISEDRYYEALLQLRGAMAMFIPVSPAEVEYHMRRAPLVRGAVVETPALATLRRYVARALLLEAHLKIGAHPAGLEGRPDETEFLLALRRLSGDCVLRQWQDSSLTHTTCRARCAWILDALAVDNFLRPGLPMAEKERAFFLPALQICGLLTGALDIVGVSHKAASERRRAFFAWVAHEVLGTRLDHDPILAARVVQLLISLLVGLLDQSSVLPAREQRVIKARLRDLCSQYPPAIRKRLLDDTAFCGRLGITVTQTLRCCGQTFDAGRFWKAVGKALAYGRSHVRTISGKRRFILRALHDRLYTVRFSGTRAVLSDPAFVLLGRSPTLWEAELVKRLEWLDMPLAKRQDAIRGLSNLPDGADRLDAFRARRDRSAAWHYGMLRDRLRLRSEHPLHAFWPPPAQTLIDYLRLSTNATRSFSEQITEAVTALATDYDLSTTVTRLSGLPVALPRTVFDSIEVMNVEERSAVLNKVCAQAHTPLQLLHALRLVRQVSEGSDDALFDVTAARLINVCPLVTRLFITLLKWTDAAYANDAEWASLPATHRLAAVWTHADRLTELLLEPGLDSEQVARDFEAYHRRGPLGRVLHVDPEYHHAAASPATVGPESLLFHGLGYVLNGSPADEWFTAAQLETVHRLLSLTAEDKTVTSPWLLVQRECADNAFGSFFTYRPSLPNVEASVETAARAIDSVLCDLETDSLSREGWLGIWAFGKPSLAPSEQLRLLAVLDNVELVDMIRRDPEDIFLCRVVVDCWSRMALTGGHSKIVAQVERLAAHLASVYPTSLPAFSDDGAPSAAQRDFSQLAEMAVLASRSLLPEKVLTRLGDISVALAAVWPSAVPLFRATLRNIMSQEPVESGKDLWAYLLKIRAM